MPESPEPLLTRHQLLALLSQQRAALLQQVIGLDRQALSQAKVAGDWTGKDLLAHLGAWDEIYAGRLWLVLSQRQKDVVGYDQEEMPARNSELYAARKDWPLEKALSACLDARRQFLEALALVEEKDLHQVMTLPWGEASIAQWTRWRASHDATHAADLAAWRQALELPDDDPRRGGLMARLALHRAELLASLVNLDENVLVQAPIVNGWTAKDLLAHVAGWDRWELQQMQRRLAGQAPDLTPLQAMESYNAHWIEQWRPRGLDEVIAEVQEARLAWQAWMECLPEEEFLRPRPDGERDRSFPYFVTAEWEHDAEHGAQIKAWIQAGQPQRSTGPKHLLLAALQAARQALLAAAAQVPTEARTSRPVTGTWNLKDLLGHVADWEMWAVDALGDMAAGRAPQVPGYQSIQSWNEAHAQARQEQPWEPVWVDLQGARWDLMEILEAMSQARLEQPFPAPWGQDASPYTWATILLDHDLEHAHHLLSEEIVSGE